MAGDKQEFQFRNSVEAVGFAMTYHVVTLDPQLSDGALRTYLLYLSYAQQKVTCWPSEQTIATERGKSTGTIQRHNAELENLGYITRQSRGKGKTWLTIIEDVTQIPRLQELAGTRLAARDNGDAQKCAGKESRPRKNARSNGDRRAKMRAQNGLTAQKCAVEEEQESKNNNLEEEQRPQEQRPPTAVSVSSPAEKIDFADLQSAGAKVKVPDTGDLLLCTTSDPLELAAKCAETYAPEVVDPHVADDQLADMLSEQFAAAQKRQLYEKTKLGWRGAWRGTKKQPGIIGCVPNLTADIGKQAISEIFKPQGMGGKFEWRWASWASPYAASFGEVFELVCAQLAHSNGGNGNGAKKEATEEEWLRYDWD